MTGMLRVPRTRGAPTTATTRRFGLHRRAATPEPASSAAPAETDGEGQRSGVFGRLTSARLSGGGDDS